MWGLCLYPCCTITPFVFNNKTNSGFQTQLNIFLFCLLITELSRLPYLNKFSLSTDNRSSQTITPLLLITKEKFSTPVKIIHSNNRSSQDSILILYCFIFHCDIVVLTELFSQPVASFTLLFALKGLVTRGRFFAISVMIADTHTNTHTHTHTHTHTQSALYQFGTYRISTTMLLYFHSVQ